MNRHGITAAICTAPVVAAGCAPKAVKLKRILSSD